MTRPNEIVLSEQSQAPQPELSPEAERDTLSVARAYGRCPEAEVELQRVIPALIRSEVARATRSLQSEITDRDVIIEQLRSALRAELAGERERHKQTSEALKTTVAGYEDYERSLLALARAVESALGKIRAEPPYLAARVRVAESILSDALAEADVDTGE